MTAFGGPLRCRDRVDTLAGSRDRARLDPQSSSGFLVLKEIVDILMDDPSSDVPYLFSVELQIFPLEAYLSTLYDAHFASHSALQAAPVPATSCCRSSFRLTSTAAKRWSESTRRLPSRV